MSFRDSSDLWSSLWHILILLCSTAVPELRFSVPSSLSPSFKFHGSMRRSGEVHGAQLSYTVRAGTFNAHLLILSGIYSVRQIIIILTALASLALKFSALAAVLDDQQGETTGGLIRRRAREGP